MMAHGATDMAAMKDPTKSLIDRAGDVLQSNIALIFPFWNGEMLDRNMAGTCHWFQSVGH
jgi:hypothetical protein